MTNSSNSQLPSSTAPPGATLSGAALIAIIAAVDQELGVGKNGTLPWHFPSDMEFFKKTTAGTTVIMGRKTWESLPKQFRPLPNRTNIVITRNPDYKAEGAAAVTNSLEQAIQTAHATNPTQKIFIIGGGQIFSQALPLASELFLTKIAKNYNCDTFFPDFTTQFPNPPTILQTLTENDIKLSFNLYQ